MPRRRKPRAEGGWVMLTLLLAMALMVIFAAAIVPSITFQMKRDREEEMIHRGVQYSRAIRVYYKKFGRYPTKIEDLESSNNQRFLRKRYKDPLNCKHSKCEDFKLLHFGDVQMSLGGIGGGTIPGASTVGTNGGLNAGTPGGPASPGVFSQPSTFGGNSGFGGNSNSSFGQNQPSTNNTSIASDTSQPGSQPTSGGPSAATSGATSGGTPDGTGTTPSGTNPSGTGFGNSGSNQLGSGQIIGGPIIGVASINKDKTIREFNHKNKYKDWAFVYDPAQDQGRLINTPYQPQLQGFGQQGVQNVNGQNGISGTGFGNGPGVGSGTFGSSSPGTQNTPATGGYGTPNPPSNPPPQQQ